jgi:magnesium transporter
VRGHLLLANCVQDEVTRPNIELALKEGKLLWLDLEGIDDEVLTLLREVFRIHPLAIEDAVEFDQRPKIEDYDDFVSVHRHPAAAIDSARATLARLRTDRRLVAVYRLLDALVDSMFPFLTAMDDRIEELQDRIFAGPKQSQLAALFEAKRQLVHIGIFGTEILAVAGLPLMFRRRGWMRKAS